MDLLNKKQNVASTLTNTILTILSYTGISDENMRIAEEFFDFSKERDLSLLDKVKFQRLIKDEKDHYKMNDKIYELVHRRGEDCAWQSGRR